MTADRSVLKLFFDGGCRPNPGRMETAVVTRGLVYLRLDEGQGTSSEAEWRALLRALDIAEELNAGDIVLVGDCANVIAQAGGKARCGAGDALAQYRARAAGFARVRLRVVKRTHNLAGIALQKQHP